MAQVFISHSSKDSALAEKVCELLEKRGVSCWIAPRDITPGSEWASEISNALNEINVFILIYTGNSARSEQVMRELSIAEKRRLLIIPYKADNVEFTGAFDYYLTGSHWITASPKDEDYKIDEIFDTIVGGGRTAADGKIFSGASDSREASIIKNASINILCQRDEHYRLTSMFESVYSVLLECDDTEERERFKKAIQSMASPTSYIVLGESGVGKTSVLSGIFRDIIRADDSIDGDICEYRWGEQDFAAPVNNGFQRKFVTDENMRGLSVIDSKGLDLMSGASLDKVRELAEGCSAVFVAFDTGHITSPRLWDIIESFPQKNMVFFLTKSDTAEDEKLSASLEKLKLYMKDSGISAPVFAVSTVDESVCGDITPMDDVRRYVRDTLVGANPSLHKQAQNIEECGKMLAELKDSFEKRKLQYESDACILQKINRSVDNYTLNHTKVINDLCNVLAAEINKDIDAYQQEIISKLDPYKIKERFRKKEDFEAYLNMVNDNYKKMMTDSVNQKVVEGIKGCLNELEKVFKEAVGYFNSRENILQLNDRFYSSLSISRKNMVSDTKTAVMSADSFYKTLNDSSYDLFMKVWEARKKYDREKKGTAAAARLGGSAAAGTASALALYNAGMMSVTGTVNFSLTAGVTAAATSGILLSAALIAVSAIVGAVIIGKIANSIYTAKGGAQMEAAVQKAIAEFKDETNKTRMTMIKNITNQVEEIFENELRLADSCFTDFRISVNTDEMKIPQIESKINTIKELLDSIEALQVPQTLN